MLHHAEFNRQPDSLIGLFGQWRVLWGTLGWAAASMFLAAFLYHLAGFFLKNKPPWEDTRASHSEIEVLMLAIIALDLPMLIVHNYAPRFYVTIIPLLAVLAGIFIEDLVRSGEKHSFRFAGSLALAAGVGVFALSMLRVFSIALLFMNDARIAASETVASLPRNSTIEYTLYPPTIPDHYFSRRHTYPLFFAKSMVGGVPDPSRANSLNLGEAGLMERGTDFLVFDSLTYERFDDPATCKNIPLECKFFRRLLAGETEYRLLAKHKYRLPDYLPQLSPFFLNPTIRIYGLKP